MLNKVWFWLLVVGIVYGFGKGTYENVVDRWFPELSPAPALQEAAVLKTNTKADAEAEAEADEEEKPKPRGLQARGNSINEAMLDGATSAVSLCIGLIGILALWLGLLQIATDAGLVDAMARALRPFMRFVFPEVPDDHPAQGAILMNLSANMLGLDNAATPMGLKAMQELQDLNDTPDTATNSMAMFLAINTSNVTIIPFTIIGYRALYGSSNSAGPLLPTLIVTSFATLVAIIAAKVLSKLPRYQLAIDAPQGEPNPSADTTQGED